MELGNALFGNSRGPVEFPRKIVNSKEWIELMNVLQVEDYHCTIGKYYYDYSASEYKERTNGIIPDEYGGYSLIKDDKIIFQLFPYWWEDCTCGADKENEKLMRKWKKELFTPYQWKTYMAIEEWCDDNCPACQLKTENKNKKEEELIKICTCGNIQKNIRLRKRQEKIKDKIEKFENLEATKYVPHKSDCALCQHNFVYHPDCPDEFWIDWYKYPFRDSYSNKELSEEEIANIFKDCIKEFCTR